MMLPENLTPYTGRAKVLICCILSDTHASKDRWRSGKHLGSCIYKTNLWS